MSEEAASGAGGGGGSDSGEGGDSPKITLKIKSVKETHELAVNADATVGEVRPGTD